MSSVAETPYILYILRCADSSYYTGITTNVSRRVEEHRNSVRGAKYLKGRGPLSLVFEQVVGDRSAASKAEYRVKQLLREEKRALVAGDLTLQGILSSY